MGARPERRAVAAAAGIRQAGLGSFYAGSVFRGPPSDLYGANVTDVNAAFFLANLTFSLAAFGAGFLSRRADPRAVGVASGLLHGAGLLGAGSFGESLPVLSLTYGVVAGVGLGLGVIIPVTVLPRWFPDRPGLAYGLAVRGFGAGPAVGAPVASALTLAAAIPSYSEHRKPRAASGKRKERRRPRADERGAAKTAPLSSDA